ncbi:hypothetical protein FA95DRAFT_1573947 [Auriscalpium vulgare]|uniref:Uncharacterized protein n=1 Tax=Auriscalpium vulgare TaxID=40419 RepID=A0ACB8RND3_9AGAM|nr:hypothetical protein FA95DRAFT_1573947 [Auriscalpium vulgare]
MLSWFNRSKHSASSDKEKDPAPSAAPTASSSDPKPSANAASAPAASLLNRELTRTPSPPSPTAEQPRKRAFTAALSTPHDAVLAELHDHHPGYDPSARIDAAPQTAPLSTETLPTSSLAPSAPPSASPATAPLYDPFTGAQMGLISPARENAPTTAAAQEELWAHLARVRELQAAIAGMHVTMEGIGVGEQAVRGARVRVRSGVGERLDIMDGRVDESAHAQAEDLKRKERERQFQQSEKRFEGRKEEIEAIMDKLGELSQALATFHALDTPIVNFEQASRTNTGASTMPTPLSRNASRARHPDMRRFASDASDQYLDSPLSLQMPLPIVEEPEGGAPPAPPSA